MFQRSIGTNILILSAVKTGTVPVKSEQMAKLDIDNAI